MGEKKSPKKQNFRTWGEIGAEAEFSTGKKNSAKNPKIAREKKHTQNMQKAHAKNTHILSKTKNAKKKAFGPRESG